MTGTERSVVLSVKGPKTLPEMTWKNIEEALDRTRTVLVPLGSASEYDENRVLGFDSVVARALAQRTAERLGADGHEVVVGPTVPLGVMEGGGVGLEVDTYKALLADVCQSLVSHGFVNVALVVVQQAAWPAVMELVQELGMGTDAEFVGLNWAGRMAARRTPAGLSGRPEGEFGPNGGDARESVDDLEAAAAWCAEMTAKAFYPAEPA